MDRPPSALDLWRSSFDLGLSDLLSRSDLRLWIFDFRTLNIRCLSLDLGRPALRLMAPPAFLRPGLRRACHLRRWAFGPASFGRRLWTLQLRAVGLRTFYRAIRPSDLQPSKCVSNGSDRLESETNRKPSNRFHSASNRMGVRFGLNRNRIESE